MPSSTNGSHLQRCDATAALASARQPGFLSTNVQRKAALWGHEDWQQRLLEMVTAYLPESFTGEITVNCSAGIAVDLTLGKIRVKLATAS